VLLAQDEPYRADGSRIENVGSFYVPNEYVLRLAGFHPEFLAGVSIHPARPDALEELARCLEGGAALLKCLPNCQNIDWADRRFTPFLEKLAEAGLPLLAHTGGERTLPVIDARLADPRVLIRPLEIGVTCIAAHCGTGGFLEPQYFETFAKMVPNYPRLFGDNSAFAVPNGRLKRRTLDACLSEPLASRILHGSDVPVPVMGVEALVRGHISRHAFIATSREPNPIERDRRLKLAMGFSESTFTRANGLLRLPAPSLS
jgi:predicted TIM-barrel fold metal-dependent hydrolase